MDIYPVCFGKWISESSNKCEQCGVQLDCYNKMIEDEKKREKFEALRDIPWYKRNRNNGDSPTYGFCEKCG